MFSGHITRLLFLPIIVGGILVPICSGEDALLRVDSVTSVAVTGDSVRFESGLPGECAVLSASTHLSPLALRRPMEGDFTFAAWLRPERLPSHGPGGFSDEGPPTVAVFSGRPRSGASGPVATLRIRKHFLELVWRSSETADWSSVQGGTYVKTGRWVHVALVRHDDTFYLFLDGQEDGRAGNARRAGAPVQITLGRSGGKRPFVGWFGRIRAFSRALPTAEIMGLATIPGHERLRVSTVDRRWLRAGVLYTEPTSFPCYPAFRVGKTTVHPLAEGCGLQFCLLPTDNGMKGPDLLMGADPRLFGSRLSLHRVVGRVPVPGGAPGTLPVYDTGLTLELGSRTAGLNARHLVALPGSAGGLLGWRDGIVLYRDRGTVAAPRFQRVGPVLFDGRGLKSALPRGVGLYDWRPADLDGDGIPDMLITGVVGSSRAYWPGGGYNLTKRNSNVGPDKGYGVGGRWLGCYRTGQLFWAKGLDHEKGVPRFGAVRKVLSGEAPSDFQVQWRTPRGLLTPALLRYPHSTWVLLFGDVERILALPVHIDAGGDPRCGKAVPLIENNAALNGAYFTAQLETVDLDGDGRPEVLAGGNPGRIVVLRGDRPGRFKEIGPLCVRGGWVATDTLSVPCRADWDRDGRPDLIVGDASGLLSVWPGTPDPYVYGKPVYLRSGGRGIRHRAGYSGSIQGPDEAGWGYLQPTVADWDADGDPDVLCNDITGTLVLYERRKSATDLVVRPFHLDGAPLRAAWRSRPAVLPAAVGFAGTDRPCLLYLDRDSVLTVGIPRRTGSTVIQRSVRLRYAEGGPIRLAGYGTLSGRAKLAVADWDGDGDWDVLFGTNVGCYDAFFDDPPPCATPAWLENTGTSAKPRFGGPRVIRLKNGDFINLRVHDASPWATDLDGNGTLDLITGAEDGKVYYFHRDELRW